MSPEDELLWLRNSVNSDALAAHLAQHAGAYDRIVTGPYLFGLTHATATEHPGRTLLLPCLHDEPFAYTQAMRAMFRGARGLLFNSEPERALAVRLYGIDPACTRVVGMGIDPFEADPAAFARSRGIAAPYVIYSGRREVLKGTPLLMDYLDAFRARTGRDVKLVLTGSGAVDPPPAVRPHIIDAGFLSEGGKREAMAGAAAFCHPSVNESLGIVLLEAWMAGTPALVHAGSDVLADQCRRSGGGLWFRNYPEFEEMLALLLDRPGSRATLAAAGRSWVLREYAWSSVEKRLQEALASL